VLTVISTDVAAGEVVTRIENNAKIGERKNMNLPGVVVDLPTLTEKDVDDIVNWGIKNDIDLIAASFVRKASDVQYIRKILAENGGSGIQVISKIENQEGLENYIDILQVTDGIMVARGDLGMEIPPEKVFLAQKYMIREANIAGKPVVTATHVPMLPMHASMVLMLSCFRVRLPTARISDRQWRSWRAPAAKQKAPSTLMNCTSLSVTL
jgi:pyruvate kinase